jgi:hypothetical protein
MHTHDSPGLLGRCREEGCTYTLFASRDQIKQAETFRDVTAGTGAYRVNNGTWARCDKRHKVFPLKAVKGTFSPDHKCDTRCLNARGHDCTCSCGGANHGRGHAVTVTTVETTNVTAPVSVAPYRINTAPDRQPGHLGEVGKTIRGEVTIERKRITRPDGPDSRLAIYTFVTNDEDVITWFCPGQYDPEWNEGETHTIRARVKRHEDHERFGKSTVVTYVEEV